MMADCPPHFVKSRQIVQCEQADTDGYGVVTQLACMSVKIQEIRLVNSITHFRMAGSHSASRLPFCYCNLRVKTYLPVLVVILFLKTEVL